VKGLLAADSVSGTGRGIRVAVIDSGVHSTHPHVQGVSDGIGFDESGNAHADCIDRLGHGTAVAAVIREKAPDAEILVAKVFDRTLTTTAEALVAAIEWATLRQAALINLSLGTTNPDHADAFERAVSAAHVAGARIVAAAPQAGAHWLPGALLDVIGVELDWTIARDVCRLEVTGEGVTRIAASGFPRPIPGVPPEKNLKGLSFAVANATGLLARALSTALPADRQLARVLHSCATNTS
jgi:hypothetical protein